MSAEFERYDPQAVEQKWQDEWHNRGTNLFTEEDLRNAEDPYYNLMMFPYPSAEGLHIGNIYAYTGADVNGRFWRLMGKDVFEPIGFDAFGIHSENYALKVGTNPNDLIPRNIENFTDAYHFNSVVARAIVEQTVLQFLDPPKFKFIDSCASITLPKRP